MIEQLELLLERDERPALAVEGLPQQLRQARDHPIGLLRILEHERRDRVQRIKEEGWSCPTRASSRACTSCVSSRVARQA